MPGGSCAIPGALLALALLFAVLPALARAAQQGDLIINRATFSSASQSPVESSVTITYIVRTPSTIEFLKYAPQVAGATPVNVAQDSYQTGSDPAAPFAALGAPVPSGSTTPIDLSQPVPLAPASIFHGGEPVFVRVTDPDQNLDRTRAETILITVTDTCPGDVEVLRLTETGPDTGVFTGYIQSAEDSSPSSYGGVLRSPTETASRRPTPTSSTAPIPRPRAAVVDPFGLVFDSHSGLPVTAPP